ncbi:MAG: hypothetical protein ACRDJN_14395 [Chloroflexota bacterium]
MTEDGHRKALDELRVSRGRLVPAEDIRAYTELSFGRAFQLICVGAQRRYGAHRERHEGLVGWLRGQGEPDAAGAFEDLESLRLGRWYGRQGNGDTAATIDGLLAKLEAWAMV